MKSFLLLTCRFPLGVKALLKRSLFLSRSASQSNFSLESTTSLECWMSKVFDDTGDTLVTSFRGILPCRYWENVLELNYLLKLQEQKSILTDNFDELYTIYHVLQIRKEVMMFGFVEIFVTADSSHAIGRILYTIIFYPLAVLPNFFFAVAPASKIYSLFS